MNRSIHRISLDIHKVGSQTVLNVKKGDTARSICVTLTENGRPYEIVENCSAVFSAKKPDGNYILNDCVIQRNEIVYDFTPQTAPVAGAMECEVSLYDKAGNQITSPRFLIVVDEVVYNDEEIVSSDEANFLKELISEVNSTVNEIETKLANGEFVGEKGEKGDKGDKGDAGADGTEGQDGVSVTHKWNGTVLTVTSASGTSSANLKGTRGDAGYTPQKGVDYWTDSEQSEILAKSAPSIVCQASGDTIVLEDASDRSLQGLKIYGRTTQGATNGLANMTITKDAAYYNSAWYTDNATGMFYSTYFDSDVLFATQSKICATSASKYYIGNEFTVKYYITQSRGGDVHNGTKYGHMNEFRLGKLYVLLTAPNSPVISCSVKYDGTEVATGEGSWSTFTDINSGTEEHTAIKNVFESRYPNNGGAYDVYENRIKYEVNIAFRDGKLTVVYGAIDNPAKQVTVVADIANADFSDAAMELSVGERKNDGIALYGFTCTYTMLSSVGDIDVFVHGSNILPDDFWDFNSGKWIADATNSYYAYHLDIPDGTTVTVSAPHNTGEFTKDLYVNMGLVAAETRLWLYHPTAANYNHNTITVTAENGQGIYIRMYLPKNYLSTLKEAGLWVNIGTTAQPYEPYKKQSLAIPTQNGLPGIPVTSGGNYIDKNGRMWICDEVDFKRGVYVQRVATKVFDGTENWSIFEGTRSDGADWYYTIPKLTDAIDEGDGRKLICDQYPTNSISNNTTRQGISLVWRNIRIRWGTPLTIDEWKAQLAEKPITVIYVLAEPVEIPIDEATLFAFSSLHTNKPNTTITNDSGAWMSVDYIADTKLYIDNKFAELAAAIVKNS